MAYNKSTNAPNHRIHLEYIHVYGITNVCTKIYGLFAHPGVIPLDGTVRTVLVVQQVDPSTVTEALLLRTGP